MLTKVKSFNYFTYNCNNNENNVLISDFVFSFIHRFENEKQYSICVLYKCDNITQINSRS